ncbi:MAG: DUF4041 domain-containing protein [Gemmatimonadetes bacterium]|nr:DUF4041 domain-containing protein [Gemmatimonadota bacterium]
MTAMDVTVIVLFVSFLGSLFYAHNRNDKLSDSRSEVSKLRKEVDGYKTRFSKVIDADKELEKVLSEKASMSEETDNIRKSYKEKLAIYEKLKSQVAIYSDDLEYAEIGLYKPHYDFADSARYKSRRDQTRNQQKALVREKEAVYCDAEWRVDGNRAEGKKMTNRNIRMTQRAFNGECDSAIASVRWNNVTRMEARIKKAFKDINKLNEPNRIYISQEYLNLKLKELWLTHEYRDKRQAEKDEQAEIRRQMREEATIQKEIDEAAKAERSYETMLQKAKDAAEKATGAKLAALESKIASLTEDLAEAREKNERAMSMAQKTKAGYVYVLSNIGSFGDGVYKIGMTRRIDPQDRVRELGDASVPFRFDVHAMIFSEDAPTLEKKLHRIFENRRLNLVNRRREFFDVTLDEIHSELRKIDSQAEITLTAEAREYKESKAIKESRIDNRSVESIEQDVIELEFPLEI